MKPFVLKRSIITTADGSKTIHISDWNEQYHSKHGALQEALHVYIYSGLQCFIERFPKKMTLSILEVGFGTGLNALLTLINTKTLSVQVNYHAVEAYPVSELELKTLDYSKIMPDTKHDFESIHNCSWNKSIQINSNFSLKKRLQFFYEIEDYSAFDIIYYDAFGPRVQPDLWTKDIFLKMYNALNTEGHLVTYSAKGSVRRALLEVGFNVERLPGPPGKREMLRATKPLQ